MLSVVRDSKRLRRGARKSLVDCDGTTESESERERGQSEGIAQKKRHPIYPSSLLIDQFTRPRATRGVCLFSFLF